MAIAIAIIMLNAKYIAEPVNLNQRMLFLPGIIPERTKCMFRGKK